MKLKKLLLFPAFTLIGGGLSGCSLLPTVTFYDDNGRTILEKDENVRLGSMASYDGKEPYKAPDDKYVYTFSGWDREFEKVWSMNTSYTAVYDKTDRYYEIKWLNDDGSIFDKTKEKYGAKPKEPSNTPTKERDNQYEYTFSRWSPSLQTVTGDQEYTAQFNSTTRKYTVVFLDAYDQKFDSCVVEYGQTPVAPKVNPTKNETAEFKFKFDHWDPAIHTVLSEKDTLYRPVFSETKQKYTVQFKNYDGTNLKTTELEYGEMPLAPADPTKPADDKGIYTFAGWDKKLKAVTEDTVYTAQYTTQHKYLVEFEDYDHTMLKQYVGLEGELPEPPTDPKRADDTCLDQQAYRYTFKKWGGGDVTKPLKSNVTFIAEYDKVRIYNIQFVYGDTVVEQWLEEGEMPIVPSDPVIEPDDYYYEFQKWDKDPVPATENAVYTAVFEKTQREKFDLTYYLKKPGEELFELQSEDFYIKWVYENAYIDLPTMIEKHYDVKWYTTPNPSENEKPINRSDAILDNQAFYGFLTEHKFNVTFNAGDGEFEHANAYPSFITYDLPSLSLNSIDAENAPTLEGHHFTGWFDSLNNEVTELDNLLEDVVLVAHYDVNTYHISFEGAEIEPIEIKYGDEIELPTPEKEGYTFEYWKYEDAEVEETYNYTENITVTPVYHLNTYSLTFDLNGGELSGEASLPEEYSIETYESAIPAPEKEGYEFEHWNVVGTNYTVEDSLDEIDELFSAGLADNFELTAVFTPIKYNVSFDYDGGSPVHYVTYKDGDDEIGKQAFAGDFCSAQFMAMPYTREGLQFAGWCDDAGNLIYSGDYHFDHDIVLHAKWNNVPYRLISVDPTNPTSKTYEYDKTILINGNTESVVLHNLNGAYLQFTSLTKQKVKIEAGADFEVTIAGTNPTTHTMYHDVCEINVEAGVSYSIRVAGNQNEEGNVSVKLTSIEGSVTPTFQILGGEFEQPSYIVEYGSEIPGFPEVAKNGYEFDGWYVGDKLYQKGDVLDVADNITIKAHWKEVTP